MMVARVDRGLLFGFSLGLGNNEELFVSQFLLMIL
jgi:hypothetical protein